MKREMPKIKRTRKLIITEKQAIGCPQGKDVIANMEEGNNIIFSLQLLRVT